MLGRPGCIGPAPDKIYDTSILCPSQKTSGHEVRDLVCLLGPDYRTGNRAQCSAKTRFLVVCNISPLFFVSRYPFQPRMDWSRPRPASSEPPEWFDCEEKNYEGTKKQKLETTPKLHMSEAGLAKVHFITWALIWFFLTNISATSGAMNSRVPTIEHFTLSIPPNSRASPKSISLRQKINLKNFNSSELPQNLIFRLSGSLEWKRTLFGLMSRWQTRALCRYSRASVS